MRDKVNQMFKDKLFLVVLVLGLLTLVAAAGIITVQRGRGTEANPYLEMPQQEMIAEETPEGTLSADSSEKREEVPETARQEEAIAANPNREDDLAAEAGAGQGAALALVLDFTDTSRMLWPVRGNVILDYSMDKTIYFPTLDQYKCNPGIVIQSDVSTPVEAPANARVLEVGTNEEIGNYVVMDLGNDYAVTCGQLKEITAVQGEYLTKGQILGYVAEPTKYYSVEGVNVFLEMRHQGETVDPLDYME